MRVFTKRVVALVLLLVVVAILLSSSIIIILNNDPPSSHPSCCCSFPIRFSAPLTLPRSTLLRSAVLLWRGRHQVNI